MNIPLIDTHRHLGGCMPTSFIWKTIDKLGLHHLAKSEADVHTQMTFSHNEPAGFHRFLDKFRILDAINWTEELIDECIKEVCADLRRENIDYTWLDMSINKYMSIGWTEDEAVKFIYNRFKYYRSGGIGLILSIKHESPHTNQQRYAKLIETSADYLVGIDLVGDEAQFPTNFNSGILSEWRIAGKMVRAHVGEYGPANNIAEAIKAGVTNIAHGLAIMDDNKLINIAIDNNIYIDLGLSSNFLTGIETKSSHPLYQMIKSGLKITLGTDDPVTCNTTLLHEYDVARELGATESDINMMIQNAIETTGYKKK